MMPFAKGSDDRGPGLAARKQEQSANVRSSTPNSNKPSNHQTSSMTTMLCQVLRTKLQTFAILHRPRDIVIFSTRSIKLQYLPVCLTTLDMLAGQQSSVYFCG
ncbi:hypothetical protein J3459_009741 [Metarhizium acridum]|nr:hypothetical protein J3459_009741 [Metarhizium acridum]